MKLGWQISLGLLIAACLILLLQWWVTANEADEPSAGADLARQGPEDHQSPVPDLAAGGRQLLESLRGEALRFDLATNPEALPAGCAPVLRVLPGGTIQIPVAPPVLTRPGPVRWARVGIVLPQPRIADLSASERSSLVAIWSRLVGADGLLEDQIHVHGCTFADGELALMLRWMR